MTPFEFEDYRKKPPKDPELEVRDYLMILLASYLITHSFLYLDIFGFITSVAAWRFYEFYRVIK